MLWTCSRWQHRGKHQRVSTVHITHSARAPTEEHLNLRPEKALKAVTPIVTFVTSYREDDARNELPTDISIDERLTCSWFANIKGTDGLPCCCCFLANRSPGGDGPFNAQPYKLVAGQDHTASLIFAGLAVLADALLDAGISPETFGSRKMSYSRFSCKNTGTFAANCWTWEAQPSRDCTPPKHVTFALSLSSGRVARRNQVLAGRGAHHWRREKHYHIGRFTYFTFFVLLSILFIFLFSPLFPSL